MKIVDSLRWTRLSKYSLLVVESKWIYDKQWIHSISRNHHSFGFLFWSSSFLTITYRFIVSKTRIYCDTPACKRRVRVFGTECVWDYMPAQRILSVQGIFYLRIRTSVVALSVFMCLVNNLDESHWEWNRFLSDCQVSRMVEEWCHVIEEWVIGFEGGISLLGEFRPLKIDSISSSSSYNEFKHLHSR
jgi:hypothetical protein